MDINGYPHTKYNIHFLKSQWVPTDFHKKRRDFMGTHKNKAYNLRLDEELMNKVRKIASAEDRPLSKQFERIVRKYVDEYEHENGNINVEIHDTHHTGDINIG